MTNASRRFLVLVFAGMFAAGVRGVTSDRQGSNCDHRRATRRIQQLDRARHRRRNHERRPGAVRARTPAARRSAFTAVSRICISKELSAKTRPFQSMVTRSGTSTITTFNVELAKRISVTLRPVTPNFAVGTMGTAGSFRTMAVFPAGLSRNAHRSRRRVD